MLFLKAYKLSVMDNPFWKKNVAPPPGLTKPIQLPLVHLHPRFRNIYREISLLSTSYKMLSDILSRLSPYID
jgi:hypothetical protein